MSSKSDAYTTVYSKSDIKTVKIVETPYGDIVCDMKYSLDYLTKNELEYEHHRYEFPNPSVIRCTIMNKPYEVIDYKM